MMYGWKEVSKIYYVINENQVLETERGLKSFEINYTSNFNWQLNLISAFNDCDLEEILLSRPFDIYEERYVRNVADGSYKTLWYKYPSSSIDSLRANVDSEGEPTEFSKAINAPTRELLPEKPSFL